MKKLIYLLPVLFLASCSPSFGGGGFIAPLICFLGAGYCAIRYVTGGFMRIPLYIGLTLLVAGIVLCIVMQAAH